MFDLSLGKTGYIAPIFPDDSPAIDYVLDASMVKRIYEAWNEKEHGELVDYGGGVRAITAEMVSNVGIDFLTGIRGIGKVKGQSILEDVDKAMKELPHG